MCHRVVCETCGKYNWEGCGLHIAEALAGLRLDQICRCDDDYDSEHPFTLPTTASSSTSSLLASAGGQQPISASAAVPFSSSLSTGAVPGAITTTTLSTSSLNPVPVPDHVCESPTPVSGSDPLAPSAEIQYRLSKISSTSADLAALRHAQQQAALKELQRIQEQQQAKLKQANQTALDKLLGGLKHAVDDTDDGQS